MDKIIVNADDYGMSPEISVSILAAIKSGVVNSASVDVCNEISHKDAGKLSEAGISIGLHLNFTEGRPIGNDDGIAELLDGSGYFKPARLNLESNVESAPILLQMRSQLDRFRLCFDRDPNHIDSHQHFSYLHPSAFEALLQLAKTFRIPMRSPKPFIEVESLRGFCERVRSRYGVTLPFMPEQRAAILNQLLCYYRPELRSRDLYLDFDPNILKRINSQTSCAEMIAHPHLENVREKNGV